MTKLLCIVLPDLLPLYYDGELSEETTRLVEEHLLDCARCRTAGEKMKHEARPLDLSGIPETLPAASSFKKWMSRLRRLAASGLGITLLLAALVGLLTFFLARDSQQGMAAVKVRSEPELHAYIYDKIPGLKKAESLGQVHYPDLELSFPGTQADLRMEKVWYTREMVYLVYSLGGLVPDDIRARMQYGKYPLTSDYVRSGVLYQGRFYGFFPLFNRQEAIDPAAGRRTLEFDLLVVLMERERQIDSAEGLISIPYDPAWEEPLFLEIEGTLPLLEGEMVFHSVEIAPTQTYLYLHYHHPGGDTLDALSGWLATDSGEKRHFFSLAESGGDRASLRIPLAALDTIPGSLNLEIERAALVSAELVEFTVDASSYRRDVEQTEYPNQHLRSIRGTGIILERLYSDSRGISFNLLFDWPGKLQQPYSVMIAGGFSDSTGIYHSYLKITTDEYVETFKDLEIYQNRRVPNLVSAVNENEEPGVFGQQGRGPGERMGIFLDSSFVKESETIFVTVKNLAYLLAGSWEADLSVIRD